MTHLRLLILLLPLAASAQTQEPPKDPGLTVDQLLERLKLPDKAPKTSAMRALGQRKAKAAVAPISACLADPDAQVRVAALEALGDIGSAEAVPSVLACLGDPSASVAIAAVRAAARFPAKEVVPALVGVLDHPQVGIRTNAFDSLRALTRLDFGYDPEASPDKRAAAIGLWRAWWAKCGGQTLAEWWRGQLASALPSHRSACARALGESGSAEAVGDLLALLDDGETPVRFEASRALVAITGFDLGLDAYAPPQERQIEVDRWKKWWRDHEGKPRREWLDAGLKDPQARNRLAAIRGLAGIATPDVVPGLIATLEDREEGVREGANAALVEVTGRDEGFDATKPETERLVGVARWEAWWKANAQRRPIDWWEATLLSDDPPANKARAAKRLGESRDPEAIRYLVQGLEDDAPGVRAAAVDGLQRLTGERLGFDADAPAEERAAAIRRWEKWREEHHDAIQEPK